MPPSPWSRTCSLAPFTEDPGLLCHQTPTPRGWRDRAVFPGLPRCTLMASKSITQPLHLWVFAMGAPGSNRRCSGQCLGRVGGERWGEQTQMPLVSSEPELETAGHHFCPPHHHPMTAHPQSSPALQQGQTGEEETVVPWGEHEGRAQMGSAEHNPCRESGKAPQGGVISSNTLKSAGVGQARGCLGSLGSREGGIIGNC